MLLVDERCLQPDLVDGDRIVPVASVAASRDPDASKRKADLIVVAFIGLHLDPVGNVVLGHARGDRGERGDESREIPHDAAQ